MNYALEITIVFEEFPASIGDLTITNTFLHGVT
jgi:hypothetical protein